MSFRISADEQVPGGNQVEDACVQAVLIEQAGADMLNVSSFFWYQKVIESNGEEL